MKKNIRKKKENTKEKRSVNSGRENQWIKREENISNRGEENISNRGEGNISTTVPTVPTVQQINHTNSSHRGRGQRGRTNTVQNNHETSSAQRGRGRGRAVQKNIETMYQIKDQTRPKTVQQQEKNETEGEQHILEKTNSRNKDVESISRIRKRDTVPPPGRRGRGREQEREMTELVPDTSLRSVGRGRGRRGGRSLREKEINSKREENLGTFGRQDLVSFQGKKFSKHDRFELSFEDNYSRQKHNGQTGNILAYETKKKTGKNQKRLNLTKRRVLGFIVPREYDC